MCVCAREKIDTKAFISVSVSERQDVRALCSFLFTHACRRPVCLLCVCVFLHSTVYMKEISPRGRAASLIWKQLHTGFYLPCLCFRSGRLLSFPRGYTLKHIACMQMCSTRVHMSKKSMHKWTGFHTVHFLWILLCALMCLEIKSFSVLFLFVHADASPQVAFN